MNSVTRIWQWVTAVMFVCAGTLMAEDAVWNQTAASWNYDWNVAANWLPGTGYPNGVGEFAGITNDIAGVPGIRLREDITIGTLAIGDGLASGNDYGMNIQNSGGESFALNFDSGDTELPAKIIMSRTGTPTSNLNVPVNLMSDLLIDLTGTDVNNYQILTFGGLVNMNGHEMVLTNGIYTRRQVTCGANSDMTGGGRIVNNSSASMDVTGKKAFAGKLIANGKAIGSNQSTFTFTGGGFTNVVECEVNGWISGAIVRQGGGIHSGSGSSVSENPGQRFTRNRITLNGGYMVSVGQTASAGVANDWQMGLEWVRDEIDVLDFKSGYNYVGMDKSYNTPGTVLDVTTLQRSPGASVYLFKVNDADKNIFAANADDILIGAGGIAGSTTMSMLPWMGVYVSGGFASPAGFATYDAVTGFRALDESTEYATSIYAGADHNVNVWDFPALSADTTINSLRYRGKGCNIGAGKTLTIASGGIFALRNDFQLGKSGDAAAGTVNFGPAEGVVSVYVSSNSTTCSTIGAVITGSSGLSKIQSGDLTLTGMNTYSGTTHVGGGILRVGDGTNPSTLGVGDASVHAGAVLQISCATAIADDATLTLFNIGPDMYYGKVALDAGISETVKSLYLGDEIMPAGTYGSSTSSATNKDDRYFAGSGVLTVTTGSGSEVKRGTLIRIQ